MNFLFECLVQSHKSSNTVRQICPKASKNIINERENEKNKLQENYEKETFIFHDRAKVKNHNMNTNEKIKKKEIIHDGYLNKFMLKPFNYLE